MRVKYSILLAGLFFRVLIPSTLGQADEISFSGGVLKASTECSHPYNWDGRDSSPLRAFLEKFIKGERTVSMENESHDARIYSSLLEELSGYIKDGKGIIDPYDKLGAWRIMGLEAVVNQKGDIVYFPKPTLEQLEVGVNYFKKQKEQIYK